MAYRRQRDYRMVPLTNDVIIIGFQPRGRTKNYTPLRQWGLYRGKLPVGTATLLA